MIEKISFEAKSRGASEIKLQHSTGETTILGFSDNTPLLMQEEYLKAIQILLKKFPNLSPKDDMFGLFTFWFTRCGLVMPISVGTFQNEDRARIGKRIREIREEQKIDAKQLALRTGVDAANISRIEQGKYSVGLDILSKIANALGYKVELVKM